MPEIGVVTDLKQRWSVTTPTMSKLDINLLNKIKEFIGKNENVDVTISLKEMDVNYLKDLEHSVQQADENNLISFTMEDFMTYKPVPKS